MEASGLSLMYVIEVIHIYMWLNWDSMQYVGFGG